MKGLDASDANVRVASGKEKPRFPKSADRIAVLVREVGTCGVFADIGCDHGYVAQEILRTGACERVIVSDVSEKCLKKAETLLAPYIAAGKATAVTSDGFERVPRCDVALIAGMGGEEIVGILERAITMGKELPSRLVLQPMKNPDKARRFVVGNGYKIVRDYLFYVKDKYYVVINCERGADELSDEEAEFGRTNVNDRPADFIRFINEELAKFKAVAGGGEAVAEKIKRYEKYVEN